MRASVAATAVNLADHKHRCVVVENCPVALAIADNRAAAQGIRNLDEESFVGFDERIAVDGYIECITRLPGRNHLAGKRARNIVARRGGRIVLGCDIEGDATGRRGQG